MHLIVCCDGTWNTPDQLDNGLPAATNVWKLHNSVADCDANGERQLTYYHPGVGTDGTWLGRMAAGGMGEGLDKNVMSAYCWLCMQYQPGDKIWLFGFSRGAYTVRSLGGMISRYGLLSFDKKSVAEKDAWNAVSKIFQLYRLPKSQAGKLKPTAKMRFHSVKQGQTTDHSIPIKFIGVWDTVGALGIPDDLALLNLIDNPAKHQFHDTALSEVVAHARHAVAIDERRQSFTPTLWTNIPKNSDVEQVWFPGVHSDVGGGYGQCGLSDAALKWMLDECARLGLSIRPEVDAQLAYNHLGQLHDSCTGVFQRLKTRPRAVPEFTEGNTTLHSSAQRRHKAPPIAQGAYWSTKKLKQDEETSVSVYAAQNWNNTGVYLEAGVQYQLTAVGEWVDGDVRCGPNGTRDGKFQLGEAIQLASTVVGVTEVAFRHWTGNQKADFWGTRRNEDLPWFSLVGVVANGVLSDGGDGKDAEHEEFLIGTKCLLKPQRGGYLHAFANDAWQAYSNNRGSVLLNIKRL